VAGQVLQIACQRLRPLPFIVHVNPVFDAEGYAPKALSPAVPTMGIRDAEDLPTLLLFARYTSAQATLDELLEHLGARVRHFLAPSHAPEES